MKTLFIAYNQKDKVVTRLIYHGLKGRYWQDVDLFLDEVSIQPGHDIHSEAIAAAKKAALGMVVLSEYTQRSSYVSQETGILLSRDIPKIYVALHDDWQIPPGYARTIKSFPMYSYQNPAVALNELATLVVQFLNPVTTGPIELVNKATRLQVEGKLDDAVQILNAAQQLDPKYDEVYLVKTNILRMLQRYDEAFRTVDDGLCRLPGNARLLAHKAFLFFTAERYREAIELYSEVLDMTANRDQYALYYKARCLERLGNLSAALELFEACSDLYATTSIGNRALLLAATCRKQLSDVG